MKKNKDEFFFKVGYSSNKFDFDWHSLKEIKINFQYYNDKAIVCTIEDYQAYGIYSEFVNKSVIPHKRFKFKELINHYDETATFTEKAICIPEDIYDKHTGEQIALKKALLRRTQFYDEIIKLVEERLLDIRSEMAFTIYNKYNNICKKNTKENIDKQLELPFKEIEVNNRRSQSTI